MSPGPPPKARKGGGNGLNDGWGWCIVAASFVVHTIVGGITYSGAVWLIILQRYFDSSQYETAWLGAILLAVTTLGGIPSTLLSYKFGYRASVMFGGALACTGWGLSSFCTELHELYLCIGALTGLGLGIALTPSVMAISASFTDPNQHRLAVGFAATGTSLGVAVFPLLIYYLEDVYAWKGVAVLLAAVCANLLVCGATIRPTKELNGSKPRRWKKMLKIFEPVLFKSVAFDVLLLSNFFWSAGASIVIFFLPQYALSTGMTLDDAVLLLSIVGGSSLASRVVFQLFSHSAKLDAASNSICSAGLAVILTGLFPEFFLHRAGEIGYAIIFGLHAGFWSNFVGAVADELITGELLAHGRGFITLSVGCGLASGIPGFAWLRDQDVDFEVIFYTAGSLMLLSSILMLLISVNKCYYRQATDVGGTESSSSLGQTSQLSSESPDASDQSLVVTSLLTA